MAKEQIQDRYVALSQRNFDRTAPIQQQIATPGRLLSNNSVPSQRHVTQTVQASSRLHQEVPVQRQIKQTAQKPSRQSRNTIVHQQNLLAHPQTSFNQHQNSLAQRQHNQTVPAQFPRRSNLIKCAKCKETKRHHGRGLCE
jgi:hypothetical protein